MPPRVPLPASGSPGAAAALAPPEDSESSPSAWALVADAPCSEREWYGQGGVFEVPDASSPGSVRVSCGFGRGPASDGDLVSACDSQAGADAHTFEPLVGAESLHVSCDDITLGQCC